jgi:hypothetical protein
MAYVRHFLIVVLLSEWLWLADANPASRKAPSQVISLLVEST